MLLVQVLLVPWEVVVSTYPQLSVPWWKWRVEDRMRRVVTVMAGVWLLRDGLVRYLCSLVLLPRGLLLRSSLGANWPSCTPFNPFINGHIFHARARARKAADLSNTWFSRS